MFSAKDENADAHAATIGEEIALSPVLSAGERNTSIGEGPSLMRNTRVPGPSFVSRLWKLERISRARYWYPTSISSLARATSSESILFAFDAYHSSSK